MIKVRIKGKKKKRKEEAELLNKKHTQMQTCEPFYIILFQFLTVVLFLLVVVALVVFFFFGFSEVCSSSGVPVFHLNVIGLCYKDSSAIYQYLGTVVQKPISANPGLNF